MNAEYIEQGDRFVDDGVVRTVARVEGDSVYAEDGTVVDAREIAHVYLPSEIIEG